MSKKKLLVISLIVISLLISACILIWRNNNSLAAGYYDRDDCTDYIDGHYYQPGDQVQFPYLTYHPNLYCALIDTEFEKDKWYTCDSVMYDYDLVRSYIVSKQTDNYRVSSSGIWQYAGRDPADDIEQEAIWLYMPPHTMWTSEVSSPSILTQAQDLYNEAVRFSAQPKLKLSSSNITISSPTGATNFAADASGKYGPFRIDYPVYDDGKTLFGDDLTIWVNGTKLSWRPNSGENFYLTVADGIKEGEKNTIRASYVYYNYVYNGVIAHYTADESGLQPVQIIVPYTTDIENSDLLDFDTGRTKIVIDLEKYDPEGNGLAGAIFKVDITGGTITSGVNPSSNAFETAAGGNRIEIKPNEGTADIDVKISEITPPTGYVLLPEDIVLHYEWDESTNKWKETHNSFSTDNIDMSGSVYLTDCYYTRIKAEDNRVIKLEFEKSLPDGTKIDGAKFKVEIDSGATFKFEDGTAGDEFITDGSKNKIIIIEPDAGTTKFTITFTETEAPSGFAIIEEPIEIEYETTDGGKTWHTTITKDPNMEEEIAMSSVGDSFLLIVDNRRKIMIDLTKTDTAGQAISGIDFNLTVNNGTLEDTPSMITTDKDGKAHIEIIPYGTDDVSLLLEEYYNKYYFEMKDIEVVFKYNGGKWEPTLTDSSLSSLVDATLDADGKVIQLNIQNEAMIEELVFEKVNANKTDEKLSGVEFKVTLDNAKFTTIDSLYGTKVSDTEATLKTIGDGSIRINKLKIDDPSKPFDITFEEISTPVANVNYRGTGKATIRITHKDKNVYTNNPDEATAEYDVENNIVSIVMTNDITLDLSGQVWEDIPHGAKPTEAPNSIRDDARDGEDAESAKDLVFDVRVISSDKKTIYDSTYPKATINSDGTYEFKDLPASLDGSISYFVEFSYDGVNYKSVTPYEGTDPARDSNAEDMDLLKGISDTRTDFDDKFKTITKGQSNGVNPLKYDITSNWSMAKLITLDGNKVKDEFKMVSNADNYSIYYYENTKYIDLGLVKKTVDLAAVTDIDSAVVKINGQSQVYDFNKLITMDNNIVVEGTPATYNIYLYRSDYNYRISHYVGLGKQTMQQMSSDPDKQSKLDTAREGGELEVTLDYTVLINNQNSIEATVNKIAYYYDSRLDLITVYNKNTGAAMIFTADGTETIDGVTYNKIIIDTDAYLEMGKYAEYIIQFKVNKDSLGALTESAKVKNWVEIISYSTTTGCVDCNSAPDNITEHKTENDTDDASPLMITIREDNRLLTGYVFNDKNGNGLDDDNSRINDVIVQLIEIKTSGTLTLEYIWQETRSGSVEGQRLSVDGQNIEPFSAMNETGQYTFENFIPGEYIVRFIYGDGTYKDSGVVSSNVIMYNGQDYKSTVDQGYQQTYMPTWDEHHNYYTDIYSGNVSSVARDNEARRLIQTGNIMSKNITSVDQSNLDDTWMCAETSKVAVGVDSPGPLYDKVNGTAVPLNVNFGLVKREGAKLSLQKHVTSLYVQDSVDAKVASMNNYFQGNGISVNLEDHGDINVSATGTNKETGNKGEWIVQTDSRDYLNGKRLEITYTYAINNTGTTEHMSNTLWDALMSGGSYAEVYNSLGNELTDKMYSSLAPYGIGKYLGASYYTNVTGYNERTVGVDVKIEDYLPVAGTNILSYQTGDFTEAGTVTKKVITETLVEDQEVKKYLTDSMVLTAGSDYEKQLIAANTSIDATSVTSFRFWSYVAHIVSSNGLDVSMTGIPVKYSNDDICALCTVRDEELEDILGGKDNMNYAAVAESIEATVKFGGTDPEEKIKAVETTEKNNTLKIVTIISIVIATVVAGMVVTRKFIMRAK